MNFGLALKHINSGKELTRLDEAFSLRMKKDDIIRRTKNGAETVARINSSDLQADDWFIIKKVQRRTSF